MAKNQRLYTDDNPETTIEGLGFKDESTANQSIQKLEDLIKKGKITKNHAVQAAVSMEQRAKHHPHGNAAMKKAEDVFRGFINEYKE